MVVEMSRGQMLSLQEGGLPDELSSAWSPSSFSLLHLRSVMSFEECGTPSTGGAMSYPSPELLFSVDEDIPTPRPTPRPTAVATTTATMTARIVFLLH